MAFLHPQRLELISIAPEMRGENSGIPNILFPGWERAAAALHDAVHQVRVCPVAHVVVRRYPGVAQDIPNPQIIPYRNVLVLVRRDDAVRAPTQAVAGATADVRRDIYYATGIIMLLEARGQEPGHGDVGVAHRLKNIIVAAGALGSPHLLLASGIDRETPSGGQIGRYLMRHANGFVAA